MSELLPARQSHHAPPDHNYPPHGYGYGAEAGYGASSSVSWHRKVAFLRQYWWLPAITLAVCMAAAVAVILQLPPTYVSTAQMWETEKLRLAEGASFTEDLQNYFGTQMGLLQSDRVMQMALESLQAAGTNSIPRDKEGKPPSIKVKVSQQPKSAMFVLEATSSNPDYAQAFLNAVMGVFQTYKKNIRQSVSGTTFTSISDQVQRLELDLKTDQHALAAFQRTNNLAILQEEGTISGGYLARLRTELSDLQLEGQLLEATAVEQENASAGNTNAAPYLMQTMRTTAPGAAVGNADRQVAYRELELLKALRERFAKNLKARHPKMVKLDADIERGQKLVDFYRNQTRDQLGSARQAIKMRIESVQRSIQDWETKVVEFKSRITEVERLKANVARSQSLYDRLMVLLENVDITRNINQDTFSILQPASPPERSYRREILFLGMSIFMGLAIGLGLVFLVEYRDDRFTTLDEVTDQFGDGVVGQVPYVRSLRRKKRVILLEDKDDQPMLGESYRSLRSALLFLPSENEKPKVVLITSAVPNEGKSTVAANLANSIASGGARVLLVDADLRKGALHAGLGLNLEPGLAELLAGTAAEDKVVQRNGIPNLSFIARGTSDRKHPGDLFLGRPLEELIARWRTQFDHIIIDCCPVFAADDVTTLAPKVDGTLFVVRRSFAGARAVRQAIDLLLQRNAKVLGLVFNRADATKRSFYQYKYADYYVQK